MRLKRSVLLVFILLFVLVNLAIAYTIYQRSLAPESSSASTNAKLSLSLASPATVAGITNGSIVTVDLIAQNTQGAGVAELVMNYDPDILTWVATLEGENILALNKTNTISTGKLTVDLANGGPGDLPANIPLVTFMFTVKDSSVLKTTFSVSNASSFGYPNIISPTDGYGSTALIFNPTICGDGLVQTPNDSGLTEICDNGSQNGVVCLATYGNTCQHCNATCTQLVTVQGARCGDSIKQSNETCDEGVLNGVVCTAGYAGICTYCNATCSVNITVVGPVCGDGVKQSNESCDDGNTTNYDQCASTCQNTCPANQIWIGNKCAPLGCKSDEIDPVTGLRSGLVDAQDFRLFGQKYKVPNLDCSLDIIKPTGQDICIIDGSDFREFGQVYRNSSVCNFN